MEYAIVLSWFATLGFFFCFLLISDKRQWVRFQALLEYERSERKELLNRIMARNLTEHVQAEVAEKVTYQQPEPERDYDLSDVGM